MNKQSDWVSAYGACGTLSLLLVTLARKMCAYLFIVALPINTKLMQPSCCASSRTAIKALAAMMLRDSRPVLLNHG